MPSFADYFNRASEQRDRLIDIEAKRVAAGIPAAGTTQSTGQGPAQPPPAASPAAPLSQGTPAGTPSISTAPMGGSLQSARSLLYTGDTSSTSSKPYRPVGGASDGNMMTRLDVDEENVSSTGRVGGMPGLKKGIARVPGKGDGTKDTVKAKLAPGEAVLNKAAADKMGRGLIGALNKMGAKKMGLV